MKRGSIEAATEYHEVGLHLLAGIGLESHQRLEDGLGLVAVQERLQLGHTAAIAELLDLPQ